MLCAEHALSLGKPAHLVTIVPTTSGALLDAFGYSNPSNSVLLPLLTLRCCPGQVHEGVTVIKLTAVQSFE